MQEKTDKKIHFSKYFKRMALIEYARLKKPNEALFACGYKPDENFIKDKKYAAKLLHKWRKELYTNSNMFNFLNFELSDEVIKREIASLENNDNKDRIMETTRIEIGKLLKNRNDKVQFMHNLIETDEKYKG